MASFILDPFRCELGGVNFNTDFKHVLRAIREMNKASEEKKAEVFLIELFGDGVTKLKLEDDLWFKLAGFIQGDFDKWEEIKEESEADARLEAQGKHRVKNNVKLYDYEKDSKEIYASFLLAYKIDLRKDNLHWYEFINLFNSLPKDTPMRQKMDVRGWKPSKGDSDEYKAHMQALQAELSLEDDDENDGSLASLLRG